MATVWTLEIIGGIDVPPGLVGVYTSKRKALEAAREWAEEPPRSRALKWEHKDGSSSCHYPDDDSDSHFLHVMRWTAK